MWWEKYMGKPWKAVPNPPESYTCGELVRCILHERCGIETPEVLANAAVLRECVRAMQPERYGLQPLQPDESPQEYDVAFMVRSTKEDHVGIAIDTSEGLMILHCRQGVGVTWDSPAEILGTGVRGINWYRHKALHRGAMPCPA